MTMKSLLLGAAAGLVTVGAAQAADLPMTKAEAVEYVKVCTEFGAGFFYIPGTDTCLKIGGQIRADYVYEYTDTFDNIGTREQDRLRFGGRGQVTWDARTDTGYGLLRTFIALNGNFGRTAENDGTFGVDKAYIQFGGLTAGFATSFFDFYANDNTIFAGEFSSDHTTSLIAYSAQFGGGFIATLSLEDAKRMRQGFGTVIAGVPALGGVSVGGVTAPDVVGSLRVTQGWGSAQLMAVLHQVRQGYITAAVPPETVGDDAKYGFAVGGGVKFNLPVLAGATWAIQGVYAKGATKYASNGGLGLGAFTPDAFVIGAAAAGPFSTKLASAWSIVSELNVALTPNLNAMLYGSYLDYNAPSAANVGDITAWQIGGNLTYTLAEGFTVAGEVNYGNVDTKPGNLLLKDGDRWIAGIRFQRNF